ncbi:DUF1853 family protein [Chitinimonas sp. PSY-7]|uniref:DUF1853 family protein n=1 Tax=Chitinimonas sp. PSY-7 TaxID=3459088 RepID=UPI00403FDA17
MQLVYPTSLAQDRYTPFILLDSQLPLALNPDQLADLNWLLCSPPLLANNVLPTGVQQGNAKLGESWWQQLPHTNLNANLPATANGFRLGRYAEALLQTALGNLPGHQLLASQLPVRDNGISLGEIDYLLRPPQGPLLHIELAVKFFIALPTDHGLRYVGPGLRDALKLKLVRLFQHQLQLANSPAGQLALGNNLPVQPMTWLRGRMFYRELDTAAPAFLAADHLRGWWRCWGEDIPKQRADSLWRSLNKPDWLGYRALDNRALPFTEWQVQTAHHFNHPHWPLQVAEYAPEHEGGHELTRGMLLPPMWPSEPMLKSLLARIPSQF